VLARFVFKQAKGLLFSWRYLKTHRPDAVIGFGGFTNAGVVLAGWMQKIPVALHEANRVPGRAVRRLSGLAARLYLPPGVRMPGIRGVMVRHTGLPVRNEITRLSRDVARAQLGVDPAKKLLVVMGGSQGASNLNQWADQHLSAFALDGVQVYCITGMGKGTAGRREVRGKNGQVMHAWFEAFSDRVGVLLSAADLVLSRAGAGTIAELVRCETPAILIPYPHAADNHQWANATYFEQQGGGVVVAEGAIDSLRQEVMDVIFNDWLLNKFRGNLRRMSHENSIDIIVHDLEDLASGVPPTRHLRHAPSVV
jgi:UDP-N-acetylglucosamine--N-acetylmuramyl-(pentapeptide) pyrophosphoryl-undecaprenol N-acetylglucosamine transferase